MRALLATASLLALIGCGRSSTRRPPAPASDGGPGARPPPTRVACLTAEDCAVLCFDSASDCCGESCGCKRVVGRADVDRLTAERDLACRGKQLDCPKVRCVVERWWPACVDGACVATQAPADVPPCTGDADCELSTVVEGACCGGCSTRGWNKQALVGYHAWARDHCAAATCPQRTCAYDGPKVARCAGGVCVATSPPAQPDH